MKGKKIKIIGGIILGVLGLTAVVVLGVKLFSVKDNPNVEDALKEEENKVVIRLKEDLNVEINSEVKIADLLEENNDIEIINVDEKIDTSSLGEKDLVLKYLENAEEKEYAIKINVVDTEKPTIKFTKELSTTAGTKINLLKNVKVSDNSKEEIKATIEGDYDFNKEGTYKLKYVAIDSSNNKTEEDFTLKVNKKKTTSTTNTTTNNNSTTDEKEENPVISTKYEEEEIDRKEYKYGIEEYTIVKYKITTRKDGTEEKVEDSRLSYYELDKFRDDAKEMRSEASSNLTTYKQDINQLFNIINEKRKANSLYEYKLDENLSLGASIRAMEVGFMNSYDNYRPNGRYYNTVLDDLGIKHDVVMSESSTRGGIKNMQGVYNSLVLYCDYNDIDCQNIFNEKFTKIGIGMFKFNNDYSYVILFEK